MKKSFGWVLFLLLFALFACSAPTDSKDGVEKDDSPVVDDTIDNEDTNNDSNEDNNENEEEDEDELLSFIDALLKSMTLEEKIGQMLQAEENHITPQEVTEYNIGSILSGGGSHPNHYDDDVDAWFNMVKMYQEAALISSSKIPLIYGTDAVHGHNNVYGATIFPHNINLGMMNNAELIEKIGEATALEMKVTGIHWNFSPAVSVGRDIRWGRTYEAFSEDPIIHANLVKAYIRGLQMHDVAATAKHFVADGGTQGGIDQGNAVLSEQEIREIHLPPFIDAIDAGVATVMVSFSSINGQKMHGSYYWLTTVLKEELGFEGLVLSDWNATFQLEGDFKTQLVTSINAGVDMLMLPMDWKTAHEVLIEAVEEDLISMERIDDAVRRILTVKHNKNLFDAPLHRMDEALYFGSESHKDLARQAARESFVLLENNNALPLTGNENVYVTGPASDHVGYLTGGWTTYWQGNTNPRIGSGTSILEALENRLLNETGQRVLTVEDADVVIVVFTELAYAESQGDTNNPSLFNGLAHPGNYDAYQEALEAKALGKTVIGVIVSGRPIILEDTVSTFDALIAVFLPGTEGGNALSEVLYGDFNFSGKLSFAWPTSVSFFTNRDNHTLYPFGYGLKYE